MVIKEIREKHTYAGILIVFIISLLTSCDKEGVFRKTISNQTSHDISLITNKKNTQGAIIKIDTVLILKQTFYTLYEQESFDYSTLSCDLFPDDSLSLIITDNTNLRIGKDLNGDGNWQRRNSKKFQECYINISNDDITSE